jgi:hypothetical protein
MFGRSKPVVIDRYASRRSRRIMPRWLWLLLIGAALGAGGVIYVQQEHLPPRLSAAESDQLRAAFDKADEERSTIAAELAQVKTERDAAVADKDAAVQRLAALQRQHGALRADIETLLDSLPPDPRGGAVEVRAARFDVNGDQLGFDVVLARTKGAAATPFSGVLQFVVAGKTARGTDTTVTLEPVKVVVGRYEIANGSLSMPSGFDPRQATIRVLDRVDGKSFGMRVLYVK